MKRRIWTCGTFLLLSTIVSVMCGTSASGGLPPEEQSDISFCAVSPMALPADSDAFIPSNSTNAYMYRHLSIVYDSTELMAMYGEGCVIGKDSTPVRFASRFPRETTASREYINSVAITRPFPVGDNTGISLWRCLFLRVSGPDQVNCDIADTCFWVAELCRHPSCERILTIDSVTTLPLMSGMEFPEQISGSDTSYRRINVTFADLPLHQEDSVYIKISMSTKGRGNPRYALRDHWNFCNRYSERDEFAGLFK